MSNPTWTRERPIVAGWYWFRFAGYVHVIEVIQYRIDGMWSTEGNVKAPINALQLDDGEWLGPITPDSYQQGRAAALDEVERYMAMRLRLAEASLATEILAGNEVKQGRERAAIAELHGMQRHVSDIKENIAQQAQEGGVGDGN